MHFDTGSQHDLAPSKIAWNPGGISAGPDRVMETSATLCQLVALTGHDARRPILIPCLKHYDPLTACHHDLVPPLSTYP